jgi:CheY-like chemotaxis protein
MKPPAPRIWLLVEDDENDFLLFRRALQRAEPESKLEWVKDGTEAQEYLLGKGRFTDRTAFPMPSVLLSDLKMPRCSGLELVQWVRNQPVLRRVPFIIFSASDQQADVGLAYQDGANWYLAKPSTFHDLVEMLSRLAENLSFSLWGGEV